MTKDDIVEDGLGHAEVVQHGRVDVGALGGQTHLVAVLALPSQCPIQIPNCFN